jgi:leucine dehydrogenase
VSITLGLASPTAIELPDPNQSEQLVFCTDSDLGLQAVIAIDDTTLGPGLGGVRFRQYPSIWAGAREAQRLARAMTAKNALAGLPYGGAKSVILDLDPTDRDALMRRFGQFVARLGGLYLPGVDMGTGAGDLALMAQAGADATCSREDPSPWTALGVFAAIRSGVAHGLGTTDLTGVRVLVQGVGHVGHSLAVRLAEHGAVVSVSDVDAERARAVADEVHGSVVMPQDVIGAECDVWAPCATARVVTSEVLPQLTCRVIAGAANDTLADESVADELRAAGILYVPDFVANAGGVIHIHGLRVGWDAARITQAVEAIGDRVDSLLSEAEATGTTPLAMADVHRDRILAAGPVVGLRAS